MRQTQFVLLPTARALTPPRVVVWLLMAPLLILGIDAARAEFRFDHLGVSEGLSQSRATAMAEDSLGRMWMGTEAGLNVFDGYRFESLQGDDPAARRLNTERIAGVFGGRLGELWVATGDGVAVVDLATEAIDSVAHAVLFPNLATGQGDQNATFLAPCAQGMWVVRSRAVFYVTQTSNGLSEKAMMTTRLPSDRELAFPGFSAVVDGHNRLWIADHHRLWRIECGQVRPTLVLSRDEAANEAVPGGSALALDGSGHLFWASRKRVDVVAIDTLGQADNPAGQSIQPSQGVITGLAHDTTDRVWVSTTASLGWLRNTTDPNASPAWAIDPVYTARVAEDASRPRTRVGFELATSSDGLVWLYSTHGMIAFDDTTRQVFRLVHDPTRPDSLPPIRANQVVVMHTDRFGGVWLSGGLSGIARYVPEKNRFGLIKNTDPFYPSARSFEAVTIDGDTYLWTAWDGERLNLWRLGQDNRFEPVAAFQSSNEREVVRGQDMVRAMVEGAAGQVWMASSSGLWRANAQTRQRRLMHVFEAYANVGPDAIYANIGLVYDGQTNELLYSHEGDVWRVVLDGDQQIESVTRLDWAIDSDGHQTGDASVDTTVDASGQTSLLRLASGHYLLGLRSGVRWLDVDAARFKDHRLTRRVRAGSAATSVNVITLANSPDGAVWLGTRQGLARLELGEAGQSIQRIDWWDERNGLPDATVYAVAVESARDVWISTNQGLSQLTWPAGFGEQEISPDPSVTDFRVLDGLPAYEFNSRAVDQDEQGRWYFGSIEGIAWFDPQNIQPHPMPPDVFAKAIRINDQLVVSHDNGGVLDLGYQDNNLAIEYAGIHFAATEQNQYAYQLEGHESQWVMAGSDRVARYANLPAGEYRFWVRSSNLDGVWSEPELLLEAKIRPPPWATPWAYVVYGLLVLGLIYLLFRRSIERGQRLEALVAERTTELGQKNELIESQAKALEESLEARTLFFANISHEFRTPLTLIQTAIDQMAPDDEHAKPKQLANRYLQRLARLVDQLLDLSRLRLSGVQPAAEAWQVNAIVELSVHGFEYLASERGIALSFQAQGVYETQADQASVEKIVLNLLSNALKYTPKGGRVLVSLDGDESQLVLSIQDTGPGIADDQKALIFERFERVASEETLLKEGAGIGLALVKEAAAAIGGSVTLTSQLGQGSDFVVRFSGRRVDGVSGSAQPPVFLSNHRLALDRAVLTDRATTNEPTTEQASASGKPRILVVEDNADLRDHLDTLLNDQWQVFQAEDGQVALSVLQDHEIDVILADLMMPNMDGLALLTAIRDNIETSHIPFLLLSARHDAEAQISGLALSADDYLTKPFSPEALKLKLGNVLATRERMRAFWVQQGLSEGDLPHDDATPQVAKTRQDLSPRDHKFLDRLNQWMGECHADSGLGVQDMAAELSMNERTLQRKIQALMGMTPLQYLTAYRLGRAQRALLDPSQTIAEVGFDCGFASQQTFARAFKQKFGLTPSQWREQNGSVSR